LLDSSEAPMRTLVNAVLAVARGTVRVGATAVLGLSIGLPAGCVVGLLIAGLLLVARGESELALAWLERCAVAGGLAGMMTAGVAAACGSSPFEFWRMWRARGVVGKGDPGGKAWLPGGEARDGER
jgi:hypothetical protein